MGIIVAASDETSTAKQINEYRSYPKEAPGAISRINTHTYNRRKIDRPGQFAMDEDFTLSMSKVNILESSLH